MNLNQLKIQMTKAEVKKVQGVIQGKPSWGQTVKELEFYN